MGNAYGSQIFLSKSWALERLELYVRGIPLKPLFSVQDRILRSFMVRYKETELRETALLVMAAKGAEGNAIANTLQKYHVSKFFKEDYLNRKEQEMREEYDIVKQWRPMIRINERGENILELM